jgi:hypothetical protein
MEWVRQEAGGAIWLSTKTISLNFGMCARVRGPLTQERLERALAGIGKRHPLLGVRAAERADGVPYFTTDGVTPVPLRIIERVNDDDWVGEVERDTQLPTRYLTEPMIRCIWIRGGDVSDLVFICDHVPADGKAAIYALRDVMTMLGDPSLQLEPIDSPPMVEIVPADIAETIKTMVAEFHAKRAIEMEAARKAGEQVDEDDDDQMPVKPVDPLAIRPFALSVDDTSALVARCRQEKVTVQSALCAAFLTPFAERDPARHVRVAEVPVDLRARGSHPVGDAYGNMIGLGMIQVDCNLEKSLWDAARSAGAALAAMRIEDLFATPQVVYALTGTFMNRPWVIEYDLSISNLGRVEIPSTYGDLTIESIYTPMFPATGPTHRIMGVNTFGGQMRCTYSARDPEAGNLMNRGRELLAKMLG